MQTRRRLFAVLAALGTATALVAGCSSGTKDSGGPLPDATPLVKQATELTRNLKSAHLVLTVNGKIPGLSMKTLSGDLTTNPTAAKGNVELTLGGSAIDADFVVVDGTLYATLTPNKWSDFGPAADIYDPSQILKPQVGLANVLANLQGAKADGRDTIDGQTTIRITGKVTAEAVNQIAPPFNATEPVPGTVWIQENGDHQLVQAKLDRGSGNSVEMTLSKWGEQVSVSKPPVS
ncbi:LppX_LprAFG lipoprotein [Mycobacterium ulcerans]|nr:LppX_LprAFG lipoprotein [Mycobacterium ulcerans]MEB3905903.1 LppX_LprAFG lipoprotein [Mycobacterium ulcerans]MEB3910067.1 LppX_LprAFG lipoprotein [Mycobacterium ulcerans]MEB3920332.1 LppX_LprAFG lipoprotein [Mycobacterium ulcerans]MEB3924404.1 LppX_LprAFG lipoprotein [Mycobacterium ulcerans]MEB3928606.1 LppX_LprAFG lipoprotein [Mycobacterium ulcerans]